MKLTQLEKWFNQLLNEAGISLNGPNPWDIQIHHPAAIQRIVAEGSLGLGESYMQGDWDAAQLDAFFYRLLRAQLHEKVKPIGLWFHTLQHTLMNKQNSRRAWRVGEYHYNLGNAFYQAMLDKRMTYTCAYWQDALDLDQAQENKLEMICQKLRLQPGMRLLDIGCGWGSLMGYAAEKYGVECVGITVSSEQMKFGQQRYAHLPVAFRLQDYREMDEPFDAVASVGMFEHVGRKNYRTFMQVAHRCLKSDGLFLLHTIGKNLTHLMPDPWLDRYIFPNGDLPSIKQIAQAVEGQFVVEDLHNFGADYDRTLMAWFDNFNHHWPEFNTEYGDEFYRKWSYYLLSCAGAFRARDIQLWQWILSKQGIVGGYQRPVLPNIET
ncbi:cyclopropane fatty acyl phospholipid synthase [Methylotenera sp. 1P/1]|uniref:cyclopropane fatty acyl phospholipid synthase n=1 Tax=Methylotenera sp. 1P/1 TaxID=1131551 RepID=UPI00037DDE92|nr:cyclopropane fatty acyl phospholipid synthase [Methylotenera sp. 1P/1]